MHPVSVNIFFNCFTPTPNCSNNSLTPPLYLPTYPLYMKTPFRPLTQAITLARSEKPKQKIKKCTATLSLSLSVFFFFFSISGHTNQSDSNRTRAAHTICLLSLSLIHSSYSNNNNDFAYFVLCLVPNQMPMASSPSLSVSAPLSHPLPRALQRTFVFSPSRTIPNPTRPASFPFHSRTFPRVPSPSPHLPLKLLCSRESKGTLSLSLIQPFLLPLIYDYACEY